MKKDRSYIVIAVVLFSVLALFWAYLGLNGLRGDTDQAELFSAVYGSMALFGGLVGLSVSKRWGGHKSLVGRTVLLISLGLLSQSFGQIAYSMYTYLLHQEIPYPSLGDVGYFGSVLFYIAAIINLIKATSVKVSYESVKSKTLVPLVPVALLVASYFVFLKGYEFDSSNILMTFLDFGYPLGQAFYISLAILAYILSRKYLGGFMRPVILFVIFAYVLQYAADFVFLYQVSRETWITGGINELMYLVSYFVMTLSLIRFGLIPGKLSRPSPAQETPDVSQ